MNVQFGPKERVAEVRPDFSVPGKEKRDLLVRVTAHCKARGISRRRYFPDTVEGRKAAKAHVAALRTAFKGFKGVRKLKFHVEECIRMGL